MITWLKAKVLSLLDDLDNLNDPFEEFTRPAYPKYQETLATKAKWFEDNLSEFSSADNTVLWYEIPLDDRLPMPVGDFAVWQGHAVAMSALKYSVTKVRSDFRDKWLEGLLQNCFVRYSKGWRLVRWVSPLTDNASNDTATGILVACYFTLQYGPEDAHGLAHVILRRLTQELVDNDLALIGPDEKPTTYGVLIQGWKTDPLRLTLCLAILRTATVFLSPSYYDPFKKMLDKYRSLIPFAKTKLWWMNSYSDTHRAASHLAILHKLWGCVESREGLRNLWRKEYKTGNAWVAFLTMWGLGEGNNADVLNAKNLLKEFYFPLSNAFQDHTFEFKRVLWNNQYMAVQPLPVWMKASDEFRWCRNPYSLVSGTNPPSARHNGLGFLLPYWFGRALGHISADE